ncbi:MAG TPA: aldose 1-epimerase [Yeosuana sp.]
MFSIQHDRDSNHLEVKNSKSNIYAKICLNDGGSLQELVLNNHQIIKDLTPLTYNNTYASSILFPFANRVKDGVYQFNDKTYYLDINQNEENNALHGLVYNKTFVVSNQETCKEFASVTLLYQEKKEAQGFPYTYTIQLKYVLTPTMVDLYIEITNTDAKPFPFTLGWHPYFLSSDLSKSSLLFDSNKKTVLDERNITKGISYIEPMERLQIKDQLFDDCYILNSNEVIFITPKYNLELTSTEEDSFLQIYTPPHKNTLAIEPTTGVSDSLNNGIGLKTLRPNEIYRIGWNIKINNN